ncbi:MAG TPA: Vms1/Ankzf1 family peptidyl-tRNA hydrolase [Gaiellales bacterium]|jgi:peptide subunit release factor 1 (eRF1)
MTVISHSELTSLAGVRDDEETAVSVYLDLDPAVTPTGADLASRVTSAVDRLRQAAPQDGGAKRRFQPAVDRIEEFLRDTNVRGEGQVHGAALFAHGEDTFAARPLWRSAGEDVRVGRRFALRRLAAADSRTSEVLLLVAGRELGRIALLSDGSLLEVLDADEDVENRHSKGGWAQSKLQRYTDRQAELHLKHVVEIAERVHARLDRPPVVIAGTEENTAVVSDSLGQELSEAVIGTIPNARDMGAADLLEALAAQAREHDARREDALLERWAAQSGRDDAERSLDWSLAAVSDARVETLLIAPGADPEIFSCPQCGRLSDHAQVCPVDGSFIQGDPDGVEAVVGETLTRGGQVWELLDVDRRDLDEVGGLGVVVRF